MLISSVLTGPSHINAYHDVTLTKMAGVAKQKFLQNILLEDSAAGFTLLSLDRLLGWGWEVTTAMEAMGM